MEDNIKRPKTILLCDDLVSAILVRLPVKSLIRFTCVSKSWNSMIRDPMFIAAHSEAYNKEDCSSRRRRYLLHMPNDPHRVSQFLTSTSAANRRLKSPFTQQHQMVAGSCQGLVCLYTGPREVGLWNPLLQIFKILPPPPSSCSFNKSSRLIFGLGYSCKDNDHKVVRILYTNTKKDNPANKVDIYSMKSNSWKSIECPAPLLPFHETGVAVNGRINWMAFPSPRIGPYSFTVMWFDIDKESFGQAVQSWDAYGSEWLQSPFVKEVLRLQEHEKYRRLSSNLWKMKTLASENSWLQLCPVRGEQRVLRVALFDGEMMLPTYSNNDLISFLGISVDGMPWEEENDSAPSWRTFHIVCVSESLRLLDHKM